MAVQVLTLPAPGWYPDPAGAATYRWWDGETWTEGTHQGIGATGVVPESLFAEPAAPAEKPEPQLFETLRLAPEPPAASAPQVAQAPVRRPANKTRWSSLLAAYPVVYPLVVGMAAALAYAGGAASSVPTVVGIAVVVAVLGLVPAWIAAEQDRRELRERGIERVPSMGWMLLVPPIAYLVVRARLLR
jgi:hypothetical protein